MWLCSPVTRSTAFHSIGKVPGAFFPFPVTFKALSDPGKWSTQVGLSGFDSRELNRKKNGSEECGRLDFIGGWVAQWVAHP